MTDPSSGPDPDANPDERPTTSSEISALVDAVQLKDRPRTGWQLRGVSDPESVAAHSWGVAYLCLVFGDRMEAEFAADERELDPNRAVRLAIVHDLAEAETGDIPTRADSTADTPDPIETDAAEQQAIAELTGPLPARLRHDWDEYESRQSPESIFAKEMDLIELCLQALAYESGGHYDPAAGDPDAFHEYDALDEFFATAEPRLRTELGHALFDEIRDRYKAARDSDSN